jgi:HD-GYP domain-containing protein (c-di-GMP phosphodiesterase class II)
MPFTALTRPDLGSHGMVSPSMAGQTTASTDAPWMVEAVETLAHELRRHHAPTADHSHRLAAHARQLAEAMRLDPISCTEVELVAMLHDVGKLAVDPYILDWPGPLDEDQRERLRRHTIEGEEMLAGIAGLEHLAAAVRATHEAWDGSGYPDGLQGDEIPLTARIVSVVDAYDAMTSQRAYRRPLTRREALARLRAGAGVQFDPRVVGALLSIV